MLKSKKAWCLGVILLATGCKTVPEMTYKQRIPELGQIQPNECPPENYQGEIRVKPNTFDKTNIRQFVSTTLQDRNTKKSSTLKFELIGTLESRRTADSLVQTIEITEIRPKPDKESVPFSIIVEINNDFSVKGIEFIGISDSDRDRIGSIFNKDLVSVLKFRSTSLRVGDDILPSSTRVPMFGHNVVIDAKSNVLGISKYNSRPVLVVEYALLGQISGNDLKASFSGIGYYCFDLTAGTPAYNHEENLAFVAIQDENLEIKQTQTLKVSYSPNTAGRISDFLNLKNGLNSPTANDSEPNLLRDKLKNLKMLYDDGLILKDEYDVKRRALLEAY